MQAFFGRFLKPFLGVDFKLLPPQDNLKDIEMKTAKIITAAALSLLAAAGAHAETYEGVQPLTSANSRADVTIEAVATARSGNVNADVASSMVVPPVAYSKNRAVVRAEAVAEAHAPNQNLDRAAFVNSTIPAQYIAPRMAQAAK
jgi:cellobiose-specific phosphotransferase system component IIB